MREQLLRLVDVQEIDAEIAIIKKDSNQYPRQLKTEEKKLEEARGQVETLQSEITEMDVERKELENNLKMEVAKLKKWEARLSDIRNQREYVALSREIESAKRQNKDTEERVLELMGTAEEKGKLLETLSDDLAVLEVDYDQLKSEIDQTMAEVNAKLKVLEEKRDERLVGIPANLVKRYQLIRDKRAGVALVPVKDGGCQGCYMQLPPQLYNVLMRMDSIEVCPSCARIIYWDGLTLKEENEHAAAS